MKSFFRLHRTASKKISKEFKLKQLKSTNEQIITNKKLLWSFLICFLMLAASAYCGETTGANTATNNVNSIFYTVYTIFSGWYTKVIALAGIVFIGIKMITSKGEERLIKALLPWLLAAILIGGGSTICSIFIKDFGDLKTQVKGQNLLDSL